MSGVRSLLMRTRRLEAVKVHPMLAALGSDWYSFESGVREGIAEGRYDHGDMPVIIASLRRWLELPPL